VTGVYGISFAIVAANAALAELWLAASGASRPWAAAGALATALGAVGLCLGYDALRIEPEADGPPQRVAVVQANVDLDEQTLADYLQLTREVLTPNVPRSSSGRRVDRPSSSRTSRATARRSRASSDPRTWSS
jgi:apolipoprotein N-acyltransferase